MAEEDFIQSLSVGIRRAKSDEAPNIQKYISENSFLLTKRFGNYNLKTIIETGYISIVAEGDQGQYQGFASFEFEPSDTLDVEKYFSYLPLNVRNTIWIRLVHFEPLFGETVLIEMLNSIFITFSEVDNICFQPVRSNVQSGIDFFSQFSFFKQEIGSDVLVKSDTEKCIFVCHRDNLGRGVKRLSIRQAVVEDNDDIIPLLSSCENVTSYKTEGEYFLANLLFEQNDSKKILLATDTESGDIVGVMYITTELDIRQILSDYKTYNEGEPIYEDFIVEKQIGDNMVYHSNAFEIKLFYIQEEYKFRSIDLLRAAFKAFQESKYCIVGIKFEDHSKSEHPLLKQFIYIEPTQECSSHSLHILSQVSMVADFFVVKATETTLDKNSSPQETILSLLRQAEFHEEFIGAVAKSFKGTRYVTMLLFDSNSAVEGRNEIIGIAVVDTQVNEFLLRRHFDFTEYIDYSAYSSRGTCQAMITHFYIEQKFYRYSKLFLKEVMRKLEKHILYYGCYRGEIPNDSLNKELIYLKSTRQIEFPGALNESSSGRNSSLSDNDSVISGATVSSGGGSRVLTNVQYDSLYFINRRYLSEEKTEIFSRIVVIGGSKTALSFIKELSANSSLFFNNIIVVSPEGDVTKSPEFYADDTDEEFNNRELLNMISLPNIYFVKDKLEDIERVNKSVLLYENQSSFITYDILLLCTSRQYKMKPKYLELVGYPKKGILNLNPRVPVNETGEEIDLTEYFEMYLHENDSEERSDSSYIVVYGSSLDALCTVNTLLNRFNVEPSKLLLIFPDGKKCIFNENEEIEDRLDHILEVAGLKYFSQYTLEDFASDEEGNLVRIYLSPNEEKEEKKKHAKMVEIDCSLFINCHSKDVDDGILSTVNRQSLVFDGRLIVDTQFRTTDTSIYSAGPMAKFSRRFGESRMMEAFNSSEVGSKVAQSVLSALGVAEDPLTGSMPTFVKNTSIRCVLPGGVRFFRCMNSQFDVEKCVKYQTNNVLGPRTINDIIEPFRYTGLYVNKQTNCIDCICYLGQEQVEEGNLASLVGLPLSYFNDLVPRYKDGFIYDFIAFLRENWVMAILCHKFISFKNETKKKLLNEEDNIGNINEVCNEIAELILHGESEIFTVDPTKTIKVEKEVTRDAKIFVQSELIDFLTVHQEVLHSIPGVYFVPKKQ
ncbi:hypothetical protein NAEGRDRAFT_73596 [Naegleria gruberi]|uniref:Uncharacterized protein FM142 n=1 Tax=Naegleria gruberi TaxID=5762 RepID=D2VX29_NAEGR|nr:uncharacterized protein NAEGRDRAFT_73596 [Naegleria gruberi]EFC38549.1 hypothetical protein NAEGRDRAFT_73596 [Naegleria gruberi]|eukprot:XP_002671293.1 hypothetical protein NAEGRDRAFT_73596 [Naegleria gruberi strain NEG-M]